MIINSERSFCALRDATYAARYRESLRTESTSNNNLNAETHPPAPKLKTGLPRTTFDDLTAENMDAIARVVFLICFIAFNMGYWTYYLFTTDDNLDGH